MQQRTFSITADQGEERISEIEDRNFKIIQLEENKEKKDYIIYEIPSEESVNTGVPEEEEREMEQKVYLKK